MTLSWTQAICERDWIAKNANWRGDVLISIDRPHLLVEPEVERCAYCGEPTIFGAYVRDDPANVRYPKEKA